jgi:capsular exopolysaccharide synthesis family protein
VVAQDRANAFALAYISYRNKAAEELAEAQSSPIEEELKLLDKQMPQLSKRISHTKVTNPSYPTLTARLTTMYGRQAYLQQQMIPYKAFEPDGGQIVAAAPLPTSPSSPSYPKNLFLSLALGLALGVGAALVREQLDDRLRGYSDLDVQTGAPVLATIPKISAWKKKDKALLSTIEAPRGAVAESYRTLRTNLQFIAKEDPGFRIVAITSPNAGEGKTTTVANLAAALAQTGQRVIAASCDLRRPRLHTFFNLSNQLGMTSVLAGNVSLAEAAQRVEGLDKLRILASGPVPLNPSELLTSEAMEGLLADFRQFADIVVIDTPPILAVSDALVLAPRCDGVLIVADGQSTRRAAVAHAREQLEQVGANIIGSVLNDFDPSQARYEYYQKYYYSSSSSYYGSHEWIEPEGPPHAGNGAPQLGDEPPAPRTETEGGEIWKP